jgi:hypothetical protein
MVEAGRAAPGPGPAGWRPANAAERALLAALERGDQDRFCQLLAELVLLVPVVGGAGPETGPAAGAPEREPAEPRLATMQLADGALVVPAYTSPEGLADPAAELLTGQHAAIPCATLARRWPDPAWVLAVNPGLPVAAHFLGAELRALVAMVFAPVNQTERALGVARDRGEALAALRTAELYLPVALGDPGSRPLADPDFPWWGGRPGTDRRARLVPVFTSPERLRGHLGVAHPEVEIRTVSLPELAAAWPDLDWPLTVNPGSPYPVRIAGAQLQRFARPGEPQATTDELDRHESTSR